MCWLLIISFTAIIGGGTASMFLFPIMGAEMFKELITMVASVIAVIGVTSIIVNKLVLKEQDKILKEYDFKKDSEYKNKSELFQLDIGSKVLEKNSFTFPDLMHEFVIEKYDYKSQTLLLKSTVDASLKEVQLGTVIYNYKAV